MIEKFAPLLAEIENELKHVGFDQSPQTLYKPAEYLLSIGGKRLRPLLTLLSCGVFSNPLKAMPQALAVEVFHNFSLMHDDIMDDAPLRRGHETVHEKWNVNTAILSGDVMLIRAYQLLANCNNETLPKVLKAFNKMATEVCEGQQMDMDFETRDSVSEAEYIQMIQLKTSVLLGCALQLGAWVGGANDEEANHLYQFGLLLGTAFQIKDDLLDCFGDPKKFGKQVGGDIVANKKTLLLIHAKSKSRQGSLEELNYWINIQGKQHEEKIEAIKNLYIQLGTKDYAEERGREYYKMALAHLDQIDSTKKQPLYQLAEQLLYRET